MELQLEPQQSNKISEQPKLSAREEKFLEFQKNRQIFDNVKKNIDLSTQERDKNLFMIGLNDQAFQKKQAQFHKMDVLTDSKADDFLRGILQKRANPEEDEKPLVTRLSTNLNSFLAGNEQGEPSLLSNQLLPSKSAPMQKLRSMSRGIPVNKSDEDQKSFQNVNGADNVAKQNVLNNIQSYNFSKPNTNSNMINTAPQVNIESGYIPNKILNNKVVENKQEKIATDKLNQFSFHIDEFSELNGSPTLTKDDKIKILQTQLDDYKKKYGKLKDKFKAIDKEIDTRSKSQRQNELLEQRIHYQSQKILGYKRSNRETQQKLQSIVDQNNQLAEQLQISESTIKQQVKQQVSKTQAKYQQLLSKLQSDLDILLDKNVRLANELAQTQENEKIFKNDNERLKWENLALFESNSTFLKKIQEFEEEAQKRIQETEIEQKYKEETENKESKIEDDSKEIQEFIDQVLASHKVEVKQLKFQLFYTMYAFIIFVLTVLFQQYVSK